MALGWTTISYGALLVPMVLGKLPSDTRKNLATEHSDLDWTIDELRDSIAREIRVLEAGSCIPPSPLKDHQRSHYSLRPFMLVPQVSQRTLSVYSVRAHIQPRSVMYLQSNQNEWSWSNG